MKTDKNQTQPCKKFIGVGVFKELCNQNTGGHKVRHKFTSNIKPN